jgi:hypothetical protein
LRQTEPILDYAAATTPTRRRGRTRLFLLLALLCFGLAATSLRLMIANRDAVNVMTMPLQDPPPPNDPYWREASQRHWLFFVSCLSLPLFAVAGVVMLILAIPADPSAG